MSAGMTNSASQQKSFQDRLSRIRDKQGVADPALQPEASVDLSAAMRATKPVKPKKQEKEISPLPSVWENIAYPAGIVGAFLIGMFAVFAARYARFHIMGGSMVGEDADIAMIMDGALATGVGFIARSVFNFETKEHMMAKTIGIFAMICVMHNLVHWAPGLFTLLFDEDYVLLTLEMTEPNSILFRGVSFVVGEPQAAEASSVMPSRIQIGQ